jgi:hypothetical protein
MAAGFVLSRDPRCDVPQRVRLTSSLPAASLGKRRVSARRGWAGETVAILSSLTYSGKGRT